MREIADRLARAGYLALVPDLFHRRSSNESDESNESDADLAQKLDWNDAAQQDIRGAARYLRTRSTGSVAVLGFSLGGALSVLAGLQLGEIDAGVCYGGIPPFELADPSKLRVPMQFHFAERDLACPLAMVERLEHSLKRGQVWYELYRYDAGPSFIDEWRPEAPLSHPAALAWKRTLDFLDAELTPTSAVEMQTDDATRRERQPPSRRVVREGSPRRGIALAKCDAAARQADASAEKLPDREGVRHIVIEPPLQPSVEACDGDAAIGPQRVVGPFAEVRVARRKHRVGLEVTKRHVPPEVEVERPEIEMTEVGITKAGTRGENSRRSPEPTPNCGPTAVRFEEEGSSCPLSCSAPSATSWSPASTSK